MQLFRTRKRKKVGLGGSPSPVVTKIKQLFITGKERRSVGVMLGPVGAFGGCWGGVGGVGGVPPPQ